MNKLRIFFISVTLLLFVFTLPLCAKDLPWNMPLPFKKATIHYAVTGNETGSETLFIKNNGQQRATHHDTTMSMMGMTTKTNTIEIVTPDWVTTYDLEERTGNKTTNPAKIFSTEYNKLSKEEKRNVEKNAEELGASLMSMGGTSRPNAKEILGHACDLTEIAGITKVYTIHATDIMLRSETSVMGMSTTITATSFDTSSAIPDTAFKGPKEIVITHDQEAEAMMTSMIHSIMDKLKQPDGAQQLKNAPLSPYPAGMGVPAQQQVPTTNQQGNQPGQEEMMQEVEQGLKMIKGLFGE